MRVPLTAPSIFQTLRHWYRYAQWLSIDVALCALAGACMAGRLTHARVHGAFYVVLPLAVWTIYTLDHLLDARRVGASASTERHRLHHRAAMPLWVAFAVVTTFTVVFALDALSTEGIVFGAALAWFVLLHLALVRWAGGRTSLLLVKELGVAVIFTAGVWGVPILRRGPGPWPVEVPAQYLLLVLANLLIFSFFERDIDEADGNTSFVRHVGPTVARRIAFFLLALNVPLVGLAILHRANIETVCAELILLLITLIHALALSRPTQFRADERYRAVCDGAFLLPFLILLVG